MKSHPVLFLLALLIGNSLPAVDTHAQTPDPYAVEWIERPWEYRYLIYSRTILGWASAREWYAEELLKSPDKAGKFGQPLPVNYDPQFILPIETRPNRQLGVLRLDIQPDRDIVQTTVKGAHLRARLNRGMSIVLTPSDKAPDYIAKFGFFFMGAYGASGQGYTPTICSLTHGDSTPIDGIGRYKADFTPGEEGYFGCREWAAQLYDKNRPYIDVTSYETIADDDAPKKKGKPVMKPITYIRPFVGFSRFDSPPKPVIGNHKGTWYCIADCPNGDQPGSVIADIKAWAGKQGWPVPKRPKNVRELIDKPVDEDSRE